MRECEATEPPSGALAAARSASVANTRWPITRRHVSPKLSVTVNCPSPVPLGPAISAGRPRPPLHAVCRPQFPRDR